jgi:hypothetical protein
VNPLDPCNVTNSSGTASKEAFREKMATDRQKTTHESTRSYLLHFACRDCGTASSDKWKNRNIESSKALHPKPVQMERREPCPDSEANRSFRFAVKPKQEPAPCHSPRTSALNSDAQQTHSQSVFIGFVRQHHCRGTLYSTPACASVSTHASMHGLGSKQ